MRRPDLTRGALLKRATAYAARRPQGHLRRVQDSLAHYHNSTIDHTSLIGHSKTNPRISLSLSPLAINETRTHFRSRNLKDSTSLNALRSWWPNIWCQKSPLTRTGPQPISARGKQTRLSLNWRPLTITWPRKAETMTKAECQCCKLIIMDEIRISTIGLTRCQASDQSLSTARGTKRTNRSS